MTAKTWERVEKFLDKHGFSWSVTTENDEDGYPLVVTKMKGVLGDKSITAVVKVDRVGAVIGQIFVDEHHWNDVPSWGYLKSALLVLEKRWVLPMTWDRIVERLIDGGYNKREIRNDNLILNKEILENTGFGETLHVSMKYSDNRAQFFGKIHIDDRKVIECYFLNEFSGYVTVLLGTETDDEIEVNLVKHKLELHVKEVEKNEKMGVKREYVDIEQRGFMLTTMKQLEEANRRMSERRSPVGKVKANLKNVNLPMNDGD